MAGTWQKLAPWMALLALPMLSGCVAAAVPLLAAGTMVARQEPEEQPPPSPQAAPREPIVRVEEEARVTVTNLTELPPPTGPRALPAGSAWQPFVAYALEQARLLPQQPTARSALLAPDPRLERPQRLPCASATPGVILDLDRGPAAFAPTGAIQPAPGLADALAQLRAAGVVVLWISQLDANRVGEVGAALQLSGLDPAGRDPLLLVRREGERKQLMRGDASESVCVVAIAGDQRADFDELFDYLRDPASAYALDAMIGDGWFLTPAPFAAEP